VAISESLIEQRAKRTGSANVGKKRTLRAVRMAPRHSISLTF